MENNIYKTEQEDNKCFICSDNIIDNTWAECMMCNILLHDNCETNDRTINNRKYCLCPHCHQVGTLGQIIKNKNDYINRLKLSKT